MFTPSSTSSSQAPDNDPWSRPPGAWGMGPEDDIEVGGILRPTLLVWVFLEGYGPGGAAAPWQRHDNPAERSVFDRAHAILDNPSSRRTTAQALALIQREVPRRDLAGARNRFTIERQELEYARALMGVEGPTGAMGNRRPATWRIFKESAGSDAAHAQIDAGQPYADVRGRFLRRLGVSSPAGFNKERRELEYARALVQGSATAGLRDASGRITAPQLPSKPKLKEKQGQTMRYQLPGSQKDAEPEQTKQPEQAKQPEQPATPSASERDAFVRRFQVFRDRLVAPGSSAAPPEPDAPATSDPAVLAELEALERQAAQPEALPLPTLTAALGRARALVQDTRLTPQDRARAEAARDALYQEWLNLVQEAQPPPAQTPPAQTPDEAAAMESIRELMADGQEAGLSPEQVRDLIADQLGQRSPGLFRRLWSWLEDLLWGDDGGSGPTPPSSSTASASSPASTQEAPPAGPDAAGAGPDEDAGGNFFDRTQERVLTVLKIVAVGAGVIILGWLIAAAYAVPKVVAAVAPAAADVVRTGAQTGVALQGAALQNADKLLPLVAGVPAGAVL